MPDYSPIRHSVWCVLRNAEGKFLLLKRHKSSRNGGLWNFPGGGIEQGEDVVKAGEREFHEECGILHKHWQKFLTIHNKERAMNYIRPASYFEPKKVWINSESSKSGWFSLQEIRDLNLHKPTLEFFKHHNEKEHLEYRKRLVQSQLFLDITASYGFDIIAQATVCLPSRKLHNVYTAPFYRGFGYGDSIMNHVMSLPQHPICLTANVGKDSKMSIADLVNWYGKFGFVPTDALASTRKSGPIQMRLVR